MPARRWHETLTWAGPLAMALVGGIALLAGDSGAAPASAIAAAAASVGSGAGRAPALPRTEVEAEARHRALLAKCQELPVAAVHAECRRNADRHLAQDRARLQPGAAASAAGSAHNR